MSLEVDRRGFLRAGLGTIAVVGAGGLLGACTTDSSPSGGPSQSSGPIRRGGTLTVGLIGAGNAETMDLSLLNTSVDICRQSQIRQGLWEYRGDSFKAKNVLAESQELSADSKTLTVNLRQGVEWHDGKPFTADDVMWTIGLWKDTPAMTNVSNLIDFKSVKKLDDKTVSIGFVMPVGDFPGIPASTWCSYIVQNGTKYADQKWGGTGPFKLVSAKPGRAVFEANPNYWEGAPYLDQVVVDSSFTDDQARYNALRAGSIDAMPKLPYALAVSAQGQSGIKVQDSPSPAYLGIGVRVDQAPFNDPRAMQALKMAQDREAIQKAVYSGYASIGNDLGMSGAPFFADDLTYPYDPEQAASLWNQAGLEGFSGEIVTSAFYAGAIEMVTAYSEQAQAAGIDLRPRKIDPTLHFSSNGDYPFGQRQMGTNVWLPASLAGYYLLGLYSDAPYNETHWGDPDSDKLLFDAIGEPDEGKAADKWHAVQKLQHERGGYLIPTNLSYIDATTSQVNGVKTTPAGNAFDNYYFAKAWKSA